MILTWWISSLHPPNARFFVFDLGASLWNSGAGGANQEWFVSLLKERGIEITAIYAGKLRCLRHLEFGRSFLRGTDVTGFIFRRAEEDHPDKSLAILRDGCTGRFRCGQARH